MNIQKVNITPKSVILLNGNISSNQLADFRSNLEKYLGYKVAVIANVDMAILEGEKHETQGR